MSGYKVVDPSTGERVSVATYLTREAAWGAITDWQNRHEGGGRPDIDRGLLLRVEVREEA